MKQKNVCGSILLASLSFFLLTGCGGKKENSEKTEGDSLEGTISMSGAFALYPLANRWAEEFGKIHPDVRFNISAGGAGKGMADALAQAVDLGMLSRDIKESEIKLGAWSVSVTKDAVIPTVNSNNASLALIKQKGLSKDELSKIFITGEINSWGQVLGSNSTEKINIYTRSDASGAAATWAQFLGGDEQDALKGVGVFGDPGLANAVKSDNNGIGYNNIIYIYDLATKAKYPGIDVPPIDINGDDKITDEELFYDNMDQLIAAINDGRYPSPPARDLYFVSKGKPESEVVKVFLRWVLTEGQRYVSETGYVQLQAERIKLELKKVD